MLKDMTLNIHMEIVTNNMVAVFVEGKFVDMVLIKV